MISPILQKKFEELFVDDFTDDQFNQWVDEKYAKEEYEKKRPSFLNQIFNWLPVIIPSLIMFSVGGWIIYKETFSRVEQEVLIGDFCTFAYKNGKIVNSWSIPVDKLTDSAKTAQKKAAEDLLMILNK